MTQKEKLLAEAKSKGLTLTGNETVAQLKALLEPKGEPSKVDSNEPADHARNGESAPSGDQQHQTAAMVQGGGNRSEGSEEAAFQATASSMKAELDKQEKVSVFVPLENGEPRGTQLPVEINGHKMFVPKGVPGVEVPKAVAEIIWQSLGVYDEATASVRSQNDPNRPLRTDLQNEADQRTIGA
jgi:uncharacterized cupin superfamily protein